MNFPIQSFLSALSLPAVILAHFVSLTTPASAQPTPEAAVIGLRAAGDDLEVELVTDPALGHVTVILRLDESMVLASATVPVSVDGLANVVLPGALTGSETREIRYHLEATDVMGSSLMEPYPFLLLFDCLGTCAYRLIPGVWTEALLVTEQLSEALVALPECYLMPNLLSLGGSNDVELRTAAQTLIHQLKLRDLDSLPPDQCRHDWQTVIPIETGYWTYMQETTQSEDGSHTVSQVGGRESGAGAWYQLQGTSLRDQPETGAFPNTTPGAHHSSTTRVEQSILCLQGSKNCLGPCGGLVDVSLMFDRDLTTETMACNSASEATARASHQLSYRVKDDILMDQEELSSLAWACPDCSSTWQTHSASEVKDDLDAQASTPVEVQLTGETRISYTSDGRGLDGATYSFTRSTFEYNMVLNGSSVCTENALIETTVTAPSTIPEDGLKMRRWWPEDPVRASGFLNPPVPRICQAQTSDDS